MKKINNYQYLELYEIFKFESKETLILVSNNFIKNKTYEEFIFYSKKIDKPIKLYKILTLKDWIYDLYYEYNIKISSKNVNSKKILNDVEENLIWQEILLSKQKSKYFKLLETFAKESYDIINEWNLNIEYLENNQKYNIFLEKLKKYRKYLKNNELEDFDILFQKILIALSKFEILLPFNIILIGFFQFSPRLNCFLNSLSINNTNIYIVTHSKNLKYYRKYIAIDFEDEWSTAIKWVSNNLLENSKKKFAIVSSNIDKNINLINRLLNSYSINNVYISLSKSLFFFDFVKAAIFWLKAIHRSVYYNQHKPSLYGKALLSGCYFNNKKDFYNYSLLDIEFRTLTNDNLSKKELLVYIDKYGSLKKNLVSAFKIWKAVKNHTKLDNWIKTIIEVLKAIGFPGEQSNEYFIQIQINQLLNNLFILSNIKGIINGDELIDILENVSKKIYTKNDNYIRKTNFYILDPSECIDISWDGVWYINLPIESKNPFLPDNFYNKLLSENILYEKIKNSTEILIISFCKTNEIIKNKTLTFIDNIKFLENNFSNFKNKSQDINIEYFKDDKGPEIDNNTTFSGGIDILELQARNPQWAFVKYRLKANKIKNYNNNNYAYIRGKIIHKSLELFWSIVKNQFSLKKIIENNKLHNILKAIIKKSIKLEFFNYNKKLIELEKYRSFNLLYKWLLFETNRPNFAISSLEKKFTFFKGRLQINIIVDRVDEIDDNKFIIIDYKTGKIFNYKLEDWFSKKLRNLQLPIYSALLNNLNFNGSINGFVIAHIYPFNFKYYGLSKLNLFIDGIHILPNDIIKNNISWEEINKIWNKSLQILTDDFINGYANNNFSNIEDIKFCDILPFLRSNLV
ncbi:hypothetical protein CKSOR_00137 [Candidatus Kinetoplastibacterium sorsogonicusi]|uniref:PD-(D/E)XK endonuclease-like domain-containing protein n=1 Tax=Candidatus Kinetoplastidibacterium kentomonadis TaxID=1576550 RepID=A0A3S7J9C5_9PROT|nr:PD-(D/E)XK nuclease family protein [Candidatus Kinetoplastibacterium sorsogonicusi]AWD32272.1 hypothetical protein CKSOR_00137 [Candidatus Kinetoplastibacterium sorsogonicusi]